MESTKPIGLKATVGLLNGQNSALVSAWPDAGWLPPNRGVRNLTTMGFDLQGFRDDLVGFSDRRTSYFRPVMWKLPKPFARLKLKNEEKIRAGCMRLAQHGWFLDLDMPMFLFNRLSTEIDENPEESAELLIQWHRKRQGAIEEELMRLCPHRAQSLRSAFHAHRDGDYYNSVQGFLREADGMWHDLFGMNVFAATARKSIVKNIERQQRSYGIVCSYIVSLLRSSLPLWMNEVERNDWKKRHRVTGSFPGLNRHEVMHGISVDYGTEINSLKAISFLNWRLLVEFVVRDTV